MSDSEKLSEAQEALTRVQNFDVSMLPRTERLGQSLHFGDAEEPARRVISLFKLIPATILPEFPENKLDTVVKQANSFYNILQEILDWSIESVSEGNAVIHRNSLIDKVRKSYQGTFDQLSPLIAYATSRTTDFGRLESEARAAVQSVQDKTESLLGHLESRAEDAERILSQIRKVAAEQGVSQEARYFADESKEHGEQAKIWRFWTLVAAGGIGIYAVLSVFVHKWAYLSPSNIYETIQLSISKLLLFAILAYLLVLCTRNFLAHMHNKILNKHRQNALMTYRTIAEAAGTQENRDVVLIYAAESIFSPRETGYTKQTIEQSAGNGPALVNLLTRGSLTDEVKP